MASLNRIGDFGNFNLRHIPEKTQIQDNMKYKIFNVKDILTEIKYAGVRKGTKTEAYLEDVIKSINETKKYRWIQFFQLVDVFYVVVEDKTKNMQEEIQDHYKNVESEYAPIEAEPATKGTMTGETGKLKSSDPVSLKTTMPWKK